MYVQCYSSLLPVYYHLLQDGGWLPDPIPELTFPLSFLIAALGISDYGFGSAQEAAYLPQPSAPDQPQPKLPPPQAVARPVQPQQPVAQSNPSPYQQAASSQQYNEQVAPQSQQEGAYYDPDAYQPQSYAGQIWNYGRPDMQEPAQPNLETKPDGGQPQPAFQPPAQPGPVAQKPQRPETDPQDGSPTADIMQKPANAIKHTESSPAIYNKHQSHNVGRKPGPGSYKPAYEAQPPQEHTKVETASGKVEPGAKIEAEMEAPQPTQGNRDRGKGVPSSADDNLSKGSKTALQPSSSSVQPSAERGRHPYGHSSNYGVSFSDGGRVNGLKNSQQQQKQQYPMGADTDGGYNDGYNNRGYKPSNEGYNSGSRGYGGSYGYGNGRYGGGQDYRYYDSSQGNIWNNAPDYDYYNIDSGMSVPKSVVSFFSSLILFCPFGPPLGTPQSSSHSFVKAREWLWVSLRGMSFCWLFLS